MFEAELRTISEPIQIIQSYETNKQTKNPCQPRSSPVSVKSTTQFTVFLKWKPADLNIPPQLGLSGFSDIFVIGKPATEIVMANLWYSCHRPQHFGLDASIHQHPTTPLLISTLHSGVIFRGRVRMGCAFVLFLEAVEAAEEHSLNLKASCDPGRPQGLWTERKHCLKVHGKSQGVLGHGGNCIWRTAWRGLE